jgi:hypothetical protein
MSNSILNVIPLVRRLLLYLLLAYSSLVQVVAVPKKEITPISNPNVSLRFYCGYIPRSPSTGVVFKRDIDEY